MARIVFALAALVFLGASVSAEDEKFVAVDWDYSYGDPEYNGAHFVIDDNVNVRSEPNLGGKKLFKLDAGDKVRVTEYSEDWEWILADGLWSPWYKISCAKGEGYICARYISSKQASFDIDFDGKEEIFACLTVCHYKNTPISEYKLSSGNSDEGFVIIKEGKRTPVDFGELGFADGFRDASYSFVNGEGLSPAVCFLVVATGFGDAGSGEGEERYFYFSGGRLKHFLTLENSGDAFLYSHTDILEFPGNNSVRRVSESEVWRDLEMVNRTKWRTTYAWNGSGFKEIGSECESEGEALH